MFEEKTLLWNDFENISMEKNDVVLRPSFKKELKKPSEQVLNDFEAEINQANHVIISRLDSHIYLKINKEDQHYWSPQLHLEIDEESESTSLLYGVFGPNPAMWTMFMFFHFIVIGFFIGFAVWAYSNYSLEEPYLNQMILAFTMVLLWFILYFIGRMGKATGNSQMHVLYDFMNVVLHK